MKLSCISKSFDSKVLFSSLNLSFEAGLRVIQGKSGCGKTTLRKIRMGKEQPTTGTVVPFSSFSYCGRDDSLFSVFSLEENINCFLKDYNQNKLKLLLTDFSFDSFMRTPLNELSGGERRKAEIIFCLLKEEDCYFLDEPFASLDSQSKKVLVRWIDSLRKEKAVVLINHDFSIDRRPDFVVSFENNGSVKVKEEKGKLIKKEKDSSECSARMHSVFLHRLKRNGVLSITKIIFMSLACFFFALALSFTDTNSQAEKNRISRNNNPYSSFRFTRNQESYLSAETEKEIKSCGSYHGIREGMRRDGQPYLFFSSKSVPDNQMLFFSNEENLESAFFQYSELEYDETRLSFRKLTAGDQSYSERKEVQQTARVINGTEGKKKNLVALSPSLFDQILCHGLEKLHFLDQQGYFVSFNSLAAFNYSTDSFLIRLNVSYLSSGTELRIDQEHPFALSFPNINKDRDVLIDNYGKRKTTDFGNDRYMVIGSSLYQDILLHQNIDSDNRRLSYILSREDYSYIRNGALSPLDVIPDYSSFGKQRQILFYVLFSACFIGYVLLFFFSYPKEKEYIKERNDVLFYQGCKKIHVFSFIQALIPILPAFFASLILYYFCFLPLSNRAIYQCMFAKQSCAEVFGAEYLSVKAPISFYSSSLRILFLILFVLVYFAFSFILLEKKNQK